tara:strand:- start:512 stop:1891 length:1380 start_codon:yes stop_codon:yes gene_type:complete
MQEINLQLFRMNKKKYLIFFCILILFSSCSFDNRSGIWKGDEDEKRKIAELEKEQEAEANTTKLYSSETQYTKERNISKKIILSKPKTNQSWTMAGLNHQNYLGNLYLTGINNKFLKKRIGKNKFSLSKNTNSPLTHKNSIIFSDDRGTVYKIGYTGKLKWKQNIYKKIYKKIYKNLTISIYKNKVYIADNIGFIYSLDFDNGNLSWIKNHGIPLKSKIKIFDGMIYLINQDNRLLSLSIKDGSVIWNVRSISSFIKSQNPLSLALSKKGYLIAVTSSGDLLKINSKNGNLLWSFNSLGSTLAHASDFFKSSDIVIANESIIFSTEGSIFSYDLTNGYINWQNDVSSVATPIIDKENIFIVTENGYFAILSSSTGKIISSTNILKILKKKKQNTRIVGFVMGSGKIYTATQNGYIIVSSATTGKVENYIKVASSITSSPIINDGKLFLYTNSSNIIGFN